MSRRHALFTEADLRRARKAAPDCTVKIDQAGNIWLFPAGGKMPTVVPNLDVAKPREVRL
jgi:hypothetical protein